MVVCDHDDRRCEVCGCCRQCYPHAVGYRDGEALQGGCRDGRIRQQLEEPDVLELGAASILARAQETSNAGNEREARELLDQIGRDRDRVLGIDDL